MQGMSPNKQILPYNLHDLKKWNVHLWRIKGPFPALVVDIEGKLTKNNVSHVSIPGKGDYSGDTVTKLYHIKSHNLFYFISTFYFTVIDSFRIEGGLIGVITHGMGTVPLRCLYGDVAYEWENRLGDCKDFLWSKIQLQKQPHFRFMKID